jgi:hypothetical protein
MQYFRLSALALLAGALTIGAAAAQEKKEKAGRQAAQKQTEPASKGSGGWQACEGGLFWSDRQSQCQLRDGRVCSVHSGTSGQAVLMNCR